MVYRKIAVFLLLLAAAMNMMVGVGYLMLSGIIPGADLVVAELLSGSPDGRPEAYVTTAQSVLLAALFLVVTLLVGIAALRLRKDRSPGFVLFAAATLFVLEFTDLLFTDVGLNLIGMLAAVSTVVAVYKRKSEIVDNPLLQDRLVGFYGDDRSLKIVGALLYGSCVLVVAGLLFTMESVLRAQPQNYLQYMQWARTTGAAPIRSAEPAAENEAAPPLALYAGDVEDEPDDVAMAYGESQYPGLRLQIAQSGVTIAGGRQFLNMSLYGFSSDEPPRAVLLKRMRLEMQHDGWKVSAAIEPTQLWETRPLVPPSTSIEYCRVLIAEELERRFASDFPNDLPEQMAQDYRHTWFEEARGFGQVAVKLSTRDNYFGHAYRYLCRRSDSGISLTEMLPDQYVDRESGTIVTEVDF